MTLLLMDPIAIFTVKALFGMLIALIGSYTLWYSLKSKKNEHWLAFGVVALVIACYVIVV